MEPHFTITADCTAYIYVCVSLPTSFCTVCVFPAHTYMPQLCKFRSLEYCHSFHLNAQTLVDIYFYACMYAGFSVGVIVLSVLDCLTYPVIGNICSLIRINPPQSIWKFKCMVSGKKKKSQAALSFFLTITA